MFNTSTICLPKLCQFSGSQQSKHNLTTKYVFFYLHIFFYNNVFSCFNNEMSRVILIVFFFVTPKFKVNLVAYTFSYIFKAQMLLLYNYN